MGGMDLGGTGEKTGAMARWHDPADTGAFICIDLKSFYAGVECVDRGLDPMEADLVVADPDRGRGTLCLAVSPHLRAQGVRNRCRVWEIPEGLDYVMARPRMRRYQEASADVYDVYLRFVSTDDIHPYSVDECLIDVAPYQRLYGRTPRQMAELLMAEVLAATGLRTTAGVGTNLFLAKVACDLLAKRSPEFVGELDGMRFRQTVWHHRPLTDIWGIGAATARRLERRFGALDLCAVSRIPYEDLRREFGVNARHLANHARGMEPCTMAEIKAYRPAARSISNGQVLMRDYTREEALVVAAEMVDEALLELCGRGELARTVSVWAQGSWTDAGRGADVGIAGTDGAAGGRHGGGVPGGQASRTLAEPTDARAQIMGVAMGLFAQVLEPGRAVRRLGVGLGGLVPRTGSQPSLLEDEAARAREHELDEAVLAARERFGRTAVMRGRSLRDEATGMERNLQIGGHHA